MSFQEAAGGMGWTPDTFWQATMTDFWRHHHGFYLFHGGKEDSVDVPNPEVIANLERYASTLPPRKRKGANVITDPREIENRMRQALGN